MTQMDPVPDDVVTLTVEGAVATLTLNRPSKLNALIPEMFERIHTHLGVLAERADMACLVIRGAGRAFCAGHDLDAIGSGAESDLTVYEAQIVDELEQFARPTIGQIHGYCVTGGLELALACDLLVCADDTRFGDTHGKWGLVPVWGMSARLPERIGLARAKELSFTSRAVDGRTAAAIGLVNRSVPAAELDETVAGLAAEIADNSREANRIFKRLYASSQGPHRAEHLGAERRLAFGEAGDAANRLGTVARNL